MIHYRKKVFLRLTNIFTTNIVFFVGQEKKNDGQINKTSKPQNKNRYSGVKENKEKKFCF